MSRAVVGPFDPTTVASNHEPGAVPTGRCRSAGASVPAPPQARSMVAVHAAERARPREGSTAISARAATTKAAVWITTGV